MFLSPCSAYATLGTCFQAQQCMQTLYSHKSELWRVANGHIKTVRTWFYAADGPLGLSSSAGWDQAGCQMAQRAGCPQGQKRFFSSVMQSLTETLHCQVTWVHVDPAHLMILLNTFKTNEGTKDWLIKCLDKLLDFIRPQITLDSIELLEYTLTTCLLREPSLHTHGWRCFNIHVQLQTLLCYWQVLHPFQMHQTLHWPICQVYSSTAYKSLCLLCCSMIWYSMSLLMLRCMSIDEHSGISVLCFVLLIICCSFMWGISILLSELQVGCIGFCMGGILSILAGQEAEVDAIVPFYGIPDPKMAKVSSLIHWNGCSHAELSIVLPCNHHKLCLMSLYLSTVSQTPRWQRLAPLSLKKPKSCWIEYCPALQPPQAELDVTVPFYSIPDLKMAKWFSCLVENTCCKAALISMWGAWFVDIF